MKQRKCTFAKSPTSIEHKRKIISRIDRATIYKINSALEPAIRQNKEERLTSYYEGRDETVGEKKLVYKK